MPELTFKSAGVSTREIDLSSPSQTGPTGVPAGVIGTANLGPAFVPITVANFSEFVSAFGGTDGKKFGPLAVNEWLKNAQALTYVRVLGAGDGKKRNSSTGKVTNAGFVVGARQVQDNGIVGHNPYANTGQAGNTFFLGCYMSQSAGSSYFTDAGISTPAVTINYSGADQDMKAWQGVPVLRGVIMAPSGVLLALSSSTTSAGTGAGTGPASTTNGILGDSTVRGTLTGSMVMANQNFTIFLNGHKGLTGDPRVITASMDVNSPSYFSKVLNTDPKLIEQKGHLLYSHYDIHSAVAVPTGSGILTGSRLDITTEEIVFMTTGALSQPTQAGGNSTVPEYRTFEDRFSNAKSPYIISQKFGGKPYDLFRVEALSDGADTNTQYKISIENLAKSNSDVNKFGKFDLVVRSFFDTDDEKSVMESFRGLSLDKDSDRYFARVVGDQRAYFDFDQSSDSQKLVVDGDFPNRSRYIRVKVSDQQDAGEVPDNALPLGYRGYSHLVTSGTQPMTNMELANAAAAESGILLSGSYNVLKKIVEPPVPMRDNIALGTGNKKRIDSRLYWGTQFTRKTDVSEPNKPDLFDQSFVSYTKYFPSFALSNQKFSIGNNAGVADTAANGIIDSDRFNNNKFTLENISVRTGSDTYADPKEWVSASYKRRGGISIDRDLKTRAFSADDLGVVGNRTFAKFSFFLQGGFDGVNIFDKDKSALNDNAAKREMDDSASQGGSEGPTVASFRKAIDIIGNKSDVEIKVLAIPGMRDESITDYATDAVENRFDAIYVMDIEERDVLNNVVTSSAQDISVSDTVAAFKNRALDSSFAAAYFPDVVMQDPSTRTNVRCPPSVAVLGAFSLNDAIGHPWFAPAGFTRGSLSSVTQASVDLNRANLDTIYDADINPITDFPGTGYVIWGQKTLQAAASALDRVNVRRLLIDIRRKVRAVANTLLFEPNRTETLEKFSGLVNPILQKIQEQSGLDRFKVVIDTTTTTQADIENNTIRGKIFVQPTRTVEFVALDFVVTNAGAEV